MNSFHLTELGVLSSCFLIGSLPFGLFIARIFRVQHLTEKGSGNIGASNVTRVVGLWPAGVLTLLLDLLKGALPVSLLLNESGRWSEALPKLTGFEPPLELIWAAGLFVVLGHCFSPWLGFRGGKGVATSLGVFLLVSPWAALAGLVGFLISFARSGISSLSSLTGAFLALAVHLVLQPVGVHLMFGGLIVYVILVRHSENLDALLANRERSFGES